MNGAVDHILSTGALVLGLAIFIGTFIIRRIVETAFPSAKKKADANDPKPSYETAFARWWNEVILYALPSIVGAVLCLANISAISQDVDIKTTTDRIIFGVVIGFLSGFFYKLIRRMVFKRTGVDLAPTRGGSVEPPAS